VVVARTGESGARGLSAFIVEKKFPGANLGERRIKWVCAVPLPVNWCFKTVKFPQPNLLGHEGEGMNIAIRNIVEPGGRDGQCGTGILNATLEQSVKLRMSVFSMPTHI